MSSTSEIEAISVRTTRINNLILAQTEATSKCSKPLAEGLCREALLDSLCVLYNECNKEFLKKKDRNIFDFVNRYRSIITETNQLRVNINDFSVKSLIGKGYFGEVHLASEKSTKDIYAIKKIRKSSMVTSAQIKEERNIMAYKTTEWITSLQYAFQDAEYLYLVMEYLPGGDLLSLMIRNGAFDEELARFYMAEITLALNALHKMGYVHRDIKPENILLDRFGHLKLADFGNATQLNKDGNVVSMSPVGTPDYIAPELLQSLSTMKYTKSVHDVTCDFWSMGVISYELITEVTPFHEDNVNDTYSKIMTYSDGTSSESLSYPEGIIVSKHFRSLVNGLVTKKSKRLTSQQIIQHPFFEGIDWDNLRHEVPPIIPTLSAEDDTSNFEEVDKKGRRSTFTKTAKATGFSKGNDFSGQNLPFIGYSYVHEEKSKLPISNVDINTSKLTHKLTELESVIHKQTIEVKSLQRKLLAAQKQNAKTDSLEKLLYEAKLELTNMKDQLKEKTMELASCKTEIKTLKSSLKIGEEMRLKSDANVSELLNATYKKWEKAKQSTEQNYEKQLVKKNMEISSLTENLHARESELKTKASECNQLQESLETYKDLLKTSKEQNSLDKRKLDKSRKSITEAYEHKVLQLKEQWKQEKEQNLKKSDELREVRQALDESICSTNSISESKLASEKNVEDIKSRLTKQIAENKQLRQDKAAVDRSVADLQNRLDESKQEVNKLQREIINLKDSAKICAEKVKTHVAEIQHRYEQACQQVETISFESQSRRSSLEQYRSAQGSLEDVTDGVAEQLKSDLLAAKQNEDQQRKRADRLEEAVNRLENAISELKSPANTTHIDNMLERKNEKLEDQLASVREQAIVERQASRTAHLSLYKLEKQIEDLSLDKKLQARRYEQVEEKMKKLRTEKEELERQVLNHLNEIKNKEDRVKDLQTQIFDLKKDVTKEHGMWEKAEHERMKEKSEILEHISRIHHLEESLNKVSHKLAVVEQRNDFLVLENKRITREKEQEHDDYCHSADRVSELETELSSLQRNYAMLKEACKGLEEQLNELEQMYVTEVKQNKSSSERNDDLWNKIKQRDTEITKLKNEINEQSTLKITAESKCLNLETELKELNEKLQAQHVSLIDQQQELITKTSDLFAAQENNEVLSADFSNLQRINDNYVRELHILKEENTRILTELFVSKEEANNLEMDRNEGSKQINDLQKEIEQLNGTLLEQKNYNIQRDIKSEATLAQYNKLIAFLQQRVQELEQKKKKTLATVLFGGSKDNAKKENIMPNVVEAAKLNQIQEELRRERTRNNQLKEQLLQAKTDLRSMHHVQKKTESTLEKSKEIPEVHVPSAPPLNDVVEQVDITSSAKKKIQEKTQSSSRRRSYQAHRFELTLENNVTPDLPYTACIVCNKQIMLGSPYMRCKECKSSVHRKCRGDVKTTCDYIQPAAAQKEGEDPAASTCTLTSLVPTDYTGTSVLRTSDFDHKLVKINCVYEVFENVLILGCDNGLYSYNTNTNTLTHIHGINGVIRIAINRELSKCILISTKGENLFMCDLRHLQSRAQASACLKPKLEVTQLEVPFADRVATESWHYTVINGKTLSDAHIIACTVSRLVIMRFDNAQNRFKPVCALDTATSVTSILFTKHSAIVSSDKFFEIDLGSLVAEEFLDESDVSAAQATYCKPMAIFKINSQEFLLCFEEFGIFVDDFGNRSRPDDVNWSNRPTGFAYRDPLLFVTYHDMVQVVRINKSYSNECHDRQRRIQQSDSEESSTDEPECRSFITLTEPKIMGDCGKLGVFTMVKRVESGDEELLIIDGFQSLKSFMSNSLETLLSSMTSIPRATSSETISTIHRYSDSSS